MEGQPSQDLAPGQPAQEQPPLPQYTVTQNPEPLIVLVVGGRGFLGLRLVNALHKAQRRFDRNIKVHVVDLEENKEAWTDVAEQHEVNLFDIDAVHTFLHGHQIQVVFNTLSEEPKLNSRIDTRGPNYYERNYKITNILLEGAKKAPLVNVFVQSSSVAVVRFSRRKGPLPTEADARLVDHTDFRKSGPKAKGHTYVDTMAAADELVLSYNDPASLATCCLRLPAVYGPNDSNITEPLIRREFSRRFLRKDKAFDPLYVDNAVEAHILAAKALLPYGTQRYPRVDGQPFFITDGSPMAFQDFVKKFQTAATAIKERTVRDGATAQGQEEGDGLKEDAEKEPAQPKLGSKLGRGISTVTNMFRRPNGKKYTSRFIVDWVRHSRTYSVEKAEEILNYKPIVDPTKGIETAVEWEICQSGQKRKAEETLKEDAKKRKNNDQEKEEEEDKTREERSEKLYNHKQKRGKPELVPKSKSESESKD